MPRIQANRDSIDDRFSVLGFTVRTESPLFEVGVATDPSLFRVERRAERNRRNFFSSRGAGAIRARRGEAVYLVPPDVLANFVGQERLYFGLATYRENGRGVPDFVQAPSEGNMYVRLDGLTERGVRRLNGSARNGASYGAKDSQDPSLEWGGDTAPPTATPAPAAKAPANGGTNAAPAPYDDGFGRFPEPDGSKDTATVATPPEATAAVTAPSTPGAKAQAMALARPLRGRALEETSDDDHGIDGPVPDAPRATTQGARALDAPVSEYPQANRFAPAARENYRASTSARTIDRIVIHITDGGPNINGTIGWFQNPQAQVSAHYVIGQDGEVVQMVRHNDVAWHARSANGRSIGIEHVANTRGLRPTTQQLCVSAALVTWLCDQFGLTVDRTTILGHSEADPKTTHTGCPNAVWDWDYYMRLADARACFEPGDAPPAAAQALALDARRRPVVSRPQEIITPFYDPADPATALTCQADAFSQAREEWFAGVPNTRIFPHSAICLLEMKDATGNVTSRGTGFYIGRNRILTCAHNLQGQASVDVVPGCNDANEPFGRFNVGAASFRIPASYNRSDDYDLAVIDNVPSPAPNDRWFDQLEELNQSRPEGVVVCGYSRKSDRVSGLTDLMNGRMQHLHAGYIAQLRGEVFDYPILTLHRASGSPVYYLSDREGTMQAYVVGVHVSGEIAATDNLNTGCRLTTAKIAWIEGRSATLGLSVATARPVTKVPARTRPLGMFDLLPVDLKWRVFIPAPAVIATVPVIGGAIPFQSARGGDGRGFHLNGGGSRAEITARFHFGGDGGQPTLTDITRSFGESTNYDRDDTVAAPGKPEWWRNLKPGAVATERGTQTVSDGKLNAALGGSANDGIVSMVENAVVVTFDLHASDPLVTGAPDIDATLAVLLKVDGDRIKARLRGGHDEFPAYELYANGVLVYSYDPVAAGGTPWGLLGDGNWDVNPETSYVDVGPASEYRAIPVHIGGAQATAQALATKRRAAKALSDQSVAVHWDTVPYYPQSSGSSCWAASAAMVVGWRDSNPVPDTEIAAKVPVFNAYKTGLFPRDRRALSDAWNLVPEPPMSYTIDSWVEMLQNCGPLYIDMTWDTSGGGHARVLVGMDTDGVADGSGTTMYMHDPWPDTPGKIKLSFADFLALYEGRVNNSGGQLEYQILHADAVPSGLRPVAAAPFALTLASEAEPPAAPAGNDTLRQVPPPEPIVQQLQLRTRTLQVPAAVPIVSSIVGAVMTRIASNAGDVTWELEQLRGFKHPNDRAPSPLPPAQDGPVITLTDWPKVENLLGDEISAGFEINWQYNGLSLGNVTISTVATNDAVGQGLTVKAQIMDDNILYPQDNPAFAALRIRFEYHFTRPIGSDWIAIRDVHLFGNGRYNISGRWTQN